MRAHALIILILTLAACGAKSASSADADPNGLPALHKLGAVTLERTDKCGESSGYEKSALFLSRYAAGRNSPDLLLTGACNGAAELVAETAGDDRAVIADIGEAAPEGLSAHDAMVMGDRYGFHTGAEVKPGHAYVIMATKGELRSLFVVRVSEDSTAYRVRLSYVVKQYQIQRTVSQSRGWDWETK